MKPIKEEVYHNFLEDTKNHSMEVLKNDGVYRHLKFTNGGSNVFRFELITWPGYLCICGDMGSYTFSRLSDMFTFFRNEDDYINPGYWSEKLCSSSQEEYKKFSLEEFRKSVLDYVEQYMFDSLDEENKFQNLKHEVSENLDGIYEEYEAYKFLNEYKNEEFYFQDCFDMNFHEYRYQFIWCLHAIVFGIGKFDDFSGQNF